MRLSEIRLLIFLYQILELTYHAFSEHNTHFLNGSSKLVLSDTALVLDVEEFECFGQKGCFILCSGTLLRQLCLQILLKPISKQSVNF